MKIKTRLFSIVGGLTAASLVVGAVAAYGFQHYQAAIETASRDTFTWVTGKYDYVNPAALKRLLV